MCYIDLEPCAMWSESPVFARKTHECSACQSAITKGDPYLKHANVFDGEFTSEKMCFPCWFAREQFAEAHGQSFVPSALISMLRDCVGKNDDEDDVWRPVLASVLRRYRRTRVVVAGGGA